MTPANKTDGPRGRTSVSVTWASVALAVQTAFVFVPGFIWAGSLNERVGSMEKYRDQHRLESVQRTDFTELKTDSVRKDAFDQFSSRVLESLRRIEEKLDRTKH